MKIPEPLTLPQTLGAYAIFLPWLREFWEEQVQDGGAPWELVEELFANSKLTKQEKRAVDEESALMHNRATLLLRKWEQGKNIHNPWSRGIDATPVQHFTCPASHATASLLKAAEWEEMLQYREKDPFKASINPATHFTAIKEAVDFPRYHSAYMIREPLYAIMQVIKHGRRRDDMRRYLSAHKAVERTPTRSSNGAVGNPHSSLCGHRREASSVGM